MMDPSNASLADGLEGVHQNGVHEELSNSAKDGVVLNVDPVVAEIVENVDPNGNYENFDQSDSVGNDNLSMEEMKEGTNDNIEGNDVTKEEEVEIIDETGKSRTRKGPVKNKNAKQPSPRGVHTNSVRKNKDGKDEEASAASSVSNGTLTLDSHPRQLVKNKVINDKQTRLSKIPGKSDAASSEAPTEKTGPRLIKKEPLDNVPGKAESSSPTAEDAKARRVGTMPNYGFSFKCNERAERRKEFYSKLEERIHAKEVEESNMQAKTKETQEAEIKKLRKKLAFKATPMPSFYQEPPPSRVELKKIPTTRAKSPKLGRRKDSISSEQEGSTNISAQQCRLSLDEKVSQSNPTKGISPPVHQKKPQRRSLPTRLTPERISSSNSATTRTSSKAVNDEKTSLSSVTTEVTILSNATREEKDEAAAAIEGNSALSDETSETLSLNIEPDEAESHMNGVIVIEDKPQLTLVQQPIAAEH